MALSLNSMNDIDYHKQYLLAYSSEIDENDLFKMVSLLENYMEFVNLNVHFTAYTSNVEAAAALVDLLEDHLSYSDFVELNEKKEEMLIEAERIRAEKKF